MTVMMDTKENSVMVSVNHTILGIIPRQLHEAG